MSRLRTLLLGLALLLTATPARAQDTSPSSVDYLNQLPPLIDRQLFFGNPEITDAQLSPNGEYLAFIKPYEDARNIWVKRVGEPFESAWPVTADDRPVPGYFWSQDSRYILYVQDRGGNENFHVWAVDPAAEPTDSTGVPPARDLTPLESVRATIYAVPEATPDEIIVGLNARDARWHDVYRVNIDTGERELLIENEAQVAGWVTDLDGDVRLAARVAADGNTEIMRVLGDSLSAPVYTCSVFESCSPIRFHKDGERVYMVTNKGADWDLTHLVLFNPEMRDVEVVESDPEGRVDFGGAEFSDATDELVATYYVGDRLRIYPKDEPFAQDLALLKQKLPEGEIYFGSSTEDETLHEIRLTSDVDPGSTYLYDRETGEVRLLYESRPQLPSEHLAHMKAIRYEARDGVTIPAYLTLPDVSGGEPDTSGLAVVVFPHGGPWNRDTWGYGAFAQFLANRGYAVFQPNFRGSTGYGQQFLNAGNAEWGTGVMQHDITDGVTYLIEEGIADPERVGIFGGSYGGYATLAGLAFTPDVYAAGVSYVGPSNLLTLLNSVPPYWAAAKRIFNVRIGDPEDPRDRERLKQQSPLFSADRINDPLMVIQGANDPRVKVTESEQIVVALRERGFDVKYLLASDEGHGFRGEENRLAVAAAMEQFFANHLGGRYQEAMGPEIARRLDALTVDPATVELPDSLDLAHLEAAQTASLPEADGSVIEPATMQYDAVLTVRGQEIDIDLHRTIAAAETGGEAAWRIIDAAAMPMGTAADTFYVHRTTLRPLRRSAGGMGTMTLHYTDEAVTGEMGMGERIMEVNVALETPVVGDGPGMVLFLAGLPLEAGYSATLRTFRPMGRQVRPVQLKVTGAQTIAVPAGTYETFVAELTPLGDAGGGTSTLYLMQDAPHYVVKAAYALPAQTGGGTMTTELTSMQRTPAQ